MMDEKDIKDFIKEAKRLGGIALRHQALKVYGNGGKFHISKTYIDDGILNGRYPYTMILIQEIPEFEDDEFFSKVTAFREIQMNLKNMIVQVTIPYFVLEASHVEASFLAPLESMRQHIKIPQGLDFCRYDDEGNPAVTNDKVQGGKGMVTIRCSDYKRFHYMKHFIKDEDVEPYKQCMIGVKVEHMGTEGTWVLDLALDSMSWIMGSIAMNNFPSYLAHLTFLDQDDARVCKVESSGKHLLTLKGKKLPTKTEESSYYLYSVKEGVIQNWHAEFRAYTARSNDPGTVELILGNHESAKRLRDIEMENTTISYRFFEKSKEIVDPGGST